MSIVYYEDGDGAASLYIAGVVFDSFNGGKIIQDFFCLVIKIPDPDMFLRAKSRFPLSKFGISRFPTVVHPDFPGVFLLNPLTSDRH